MGDVFKEQLVKAKPTSKDKLQQVGIIIGIIVIAVVSFLFVGGFFAIITAAAIFGGVYLMQFTKKEYEYCLTNNELDIDVIYNKQRRKHLLTVDLKKINVCASIKDPKHQEALARGQKIIDASNGEETKDTYALVYGDAGQTIKLLVSPNQEMIQLFYKQAPNKVFKQM